MANFIAKLIPFILLGVALVAFAFGLLLLTYLLFFGALIGLVLFAVSWIKQKFFASKDLTKRSSKSGRIIDHKD